MKNHSADKGLIIIIFFLVIFGLVILSSASIEISRKHFDKPYYYFFHQLIYGVGIGLIFFFLAQKIHYRFWKKWALIILFFCIVALFLIFVPGLGIDNGGAKRWLNLKYFSFQPSELMKLGFIIYLAAWLERRKEKIKIFAKSTLPFLIVTGLIGILIFNQPDIGTLGVISIIGMVVFFTAGAKLSHILIIVLSTLTAFFTVIKIAPYRMNRLLVYLNPDIDPLGISYQIKQALLAIGSGGLLGIGLGHSRQKYNYLPSPASDSVFAITAEEFGFVGAIALISLFLALAIKGFKIAKNSPDRFAKFTAIGITFWLVSQAFINVGAIIGLIPLTGITLPFISYGASSMIVSLCGAGILVNISKHTY